MNGVEILSSEQVVAEAIFNWTAFWIAFGITLGIYTLVAVVQLISAHHYNWITILQLSVIGIVASAWFGVIGGVVFSIPTTYETQYKVTTSDEVSMNEFYEYYEILDQEGKIYTVKERVND